jgi:hypothetical protein
MPPPRSHPLSLRLCTLMHIELASEVLRGSNSVARERGWREELALALGTGSHHWYLARVPHDDEAAISLPTRNSDLGTAQMRFKLLRDCAELYSVWEGIGQLAISALQETAFGGHYDSDAVRRRRRRAFGRHEIVHVRDTFRTDVRPRLCQIVVVGCCPSNRFNEIIDWTPPPVSGTLVQLLSHIGASHSTSADVCSVRRISWFAR